MKEKTEEMFHLTAQMFETTGKQYQGVRYATKNGRLTVEEPMNVVTVLPENGQAYQLSFGLRSEELSKKTGVIRFAYDWGFGIQRELTRRLATALLADLFGSSDLIRNLVPAFDRDVIRKLPDNWRLSEAEIKKMYEVELTLECLGSLGKIK